jgi:hypothetical protein
MAMAATRLVCPHDFHLRWELHREPGQVLGTIRFVQLVQSVDDEQDPRVRRHLGEELAERHGQPRHVFGHFVG